MANTWKAVAQGIAFAANKPMLAVQNAGTRVIRIRRAYMLNNQTAAVTGVLCALELRRYTGAGISGHTTVTPIALDTTNSALSSVTCYHTGTPTGTPDVARRLMWSSDEAAVSGATLDELECIPALCAIWDIGYADANVQPLALRQNEAFVIYNVSGAAGLVDLEIEFTDEAT